MKQIRRLAVLGVLIATSSPSHGTEEVVRLQHYFTATRELEHGDHGHPRAFIVYGNVGMFFGHDREADKKAKDASNNRFRVYTVEEIDVIVKQSQTAAEQTKLDLMKSISTAVKESLTPQQIKEIKEVVIGEVRKELKSELREELKQEILAELRASIKK